MTTVKEVVNDVTIDYQAKRTDTEIAADVKSRLQWDIWIDGDLIKFAVHRAPRDVIDLLEIYGAAFPPERAEAIRLFVVTTFGATVKAGGVSTNPHDAPRALAELTALTAAAVAGNLSLREVLAPPTPTQR